MRRETRYSCMLRAQDIIAVLLSFFVYFPRRIINRLPIFGSAVSASIIAINLVVTTPFISVFAPRFNKHIDLSVFTDILIHERKWRLCGRPCRDEQRLRRGWQCVCASSISNLRAMPLLTFMESCQISCSQKRNI